VPEAPRRPGWSTAWTKVAINEKMTMGARQFRTSMALATCLLLLGSLWLPNVSQAKTAAEIDASANAALARFDQQVNGGAKFLATAKGVLVLPEVVKAAFVFGGQYGEGVLRVGGHDVGYYSIAGGSWGASIGIQKKDIIIVFRDAGALKHFETTSGWQVGVTGDITLVNVGAGADLSTMQINQPIVAFVVGQKGLMFDVSLTGAKISKLTR
jgi:lipid-binding SYLF domain-containing protein